MTAWDRGRITLLFLGIASGCLTWILASAPVPAQRPETTLWQLYKIDTQADHPQADSLEKGTAVSKHADGSFTRTILAGRGLNNEGSVWHIWPKEGRASYTRPKPAGSLEVSWTVPPSTLSTDQDLKLAISVVARGDVVGGAAFGDNPVQMFDHKPELVVGKQPWFGGGGGVYAGNLGGPFVPTAAGSTVVRVRKVGYIGQKDLEFRVYLVDWAYPFEVHYHYQPIEPGKEPPLPPPAKGCAYTFGKEWHSDWGKLIIKLDGAKATGTYTNRKGTFGPGKFSGTVTGHVLDADWQDGNGEGTFTLLLGADGCSFSGTHTVKPPMPSGPTPGPKGTDPAHNPPTTTSPGPPSGFPADPGMDPTGQRCIDEWIKLAMSIRNRRDKSNPAPNGPWRVNENGQLVGHGVSSAGPPDGWETRYRRSRYLVIWETWQQAHILPAYGGELPPLKDYVEKCFVKHPAAGMRPPTGYPPGTTAGTKMALVAEHRTVIAGETVMVPVWLVNGADIANINFTASHDGNVARLEGEPVKGNLLGEALFSANPKEAGLIRLGFAQSKGLSGTGTVAYLPFRAVGKPGDRTPLRLEVQVINNPGGTVLASDKIDGSITIVGPDGAVPGDCDGDGNLTALDAKCALDMSVKLIPEKKHLDMDGDSQVTSRDATIILQRRAMYLARGQQ
jgi:hypothetical protein